MRPQTPCIHQQPPHGRRLPISSAPSPTVYTIHILSAINHARAACVTVKAAIYGGSQAAITRAANHLKLLLHVALQNAQKLLLTARAVRARRRRTRAATRLMRPSLSASASWNISSRTFCGSVRRDTAAGVCMAWHGMAGTAPRFPPCPAWPTPCARRHEEHATTRAAAERRHLSRSSFVM
jgi:hypothetical protein